MLYNKHVVLGCFVFFRTLIFVNTIINVKRLFKDGKYFFFFEVNNTLLAGSCKLKLLLKLLKVNNTTKLI